MVSYRDRSGHTACLALLPRRQPTGGNRAFPARFMSHLTVRCAAQGLIRHKTTLTVEGLEWIPRSGPVLIAARHFHHLYDGCALLSIIPRRLHLLVALDWITRRWLRRVMERACALLDWPIVLRSERLASSASGGQCASASNEGLRYLRCAVSETTRLLCSGEALVIFPEAYPHIDPVYTPKQNEAAFLPFRHGFARLLALAESDGAGPIAIIPAGLSYQHKERWHITLRFGPPLFRQDFADQNHLLHAVEQRVRFLSRPHAAYTALDAEEVIGR
jgi:1-acyl-sn-glycerol-3-phosphate acyltransferase